MVVFAGTPGTFTPGGAWTLLLSDDTNVFYRVCY